MARTPFELKGKTVFVAGHGGMVGGALLRLRVGAAFLVCTECWLRNSVQSNAKKILATS
jgi:hypothetical protein